MLFTGAPIAISPRATDDGCRWVGGFSGAGVGAGVEGGLDADMLDPMLVVDDFESIAGWKPTLCIHWLSYAFTASSTVVVMVKMASSRAISMMPCTLGCSPQRVSFPPPFVCV